MYDKNLIKDRIYELRKTRLKQYNDNFQSLNNPNEKYSCCKSQETLALELGIERRAVGSWERGSSIPSLENLVNLSNLLDCNIDYFLGADEIPEISPISKASHYTGIDSEILTHGLNHSDYLDFLNYFMHPERCSSLFNNMTLIAWKTFLNNQELSDINEPLKNFIRDVFSQFYATTQFSIISYDSYKAFLISKLPEKLISFSSKTDSVFSVNECLSIKKFKELNLSKNRPSRYDEFINYLVEYTFDPLSSSVFLELQKAKLANSFVSLINDYLSDN